MFWKTPLAILALAVSLAGCGGTGSDPAVTNPNGDEPAGPPTDAREEINSVVHSDAIFDLDDRRVRTDLWACREDLSFICHAFVGELQAVADPRGEFTYRVFGQWEHLYAAGVVQTKTVLFAATAGVHHPNSLPTGSATWTGSMVGVHRPPETPLGEHGRIVRGGAQITLPDLQAPAIDVELTPQSLPAMTWEAIPVEDGRFDEDWPTTADAPWPGPPNRRSYISGEFYGPSAEEVGGVFERAGIIGAFGAARQLPTASN